MKRLKNEPHSSPGSGSNQPGFQLARQASLLAREHPGEWQDLRTGIRQQHAYQKVHELRRMPSALFRQGGFEFRHERRDDGYAVQVRYVGEPS